MLFNSFQEEARRWSAPATNERERSAEREGTPMSTRKRCGGSKNSHSDSSSSCSGSPNLVKEANQQTMDHMVRGAGKGDLEALAFLLVIVPGLVRRFALGCVGGCTWLLEELVEAASFRINRRVGCAQSTFHWLSYAQFCQFVKVVVQNLAHTKSRNAEKSGIS